MNKLLEVKQLCKGYPSGKQRLAVLIDLSLDLFEGEMIAVTGVSGSGKSTLLHLIGGMDAPDQGTIRVAGREISDLSMMELSRFRNETLGFVFQFHHLLPEFTAIENIMMPLMLRKAHRARAKEAAQELLKEVGLLDRADHRPGELSGGEQQRVALARALVGQPKLLLADEPTGNLDPDTGMAIGELFRSLHEKRRLTSILVTHNEALAKICSGTYHLEHGRLAKI